MAVAVFDPDGPGLRVRFTFTGLILASYTFTLWSATDNSWVMHESGNNQNPADDAYDLPLLVKDNAGRLVQLRTEFIAADGEAGTEYDIMAELVQGDRQLAEVHDKGELTGKAQSSLLYIKLKTA